MTLKSYKPILCAIASALLSNTQAQAAQWFASAGYDTGGETAITAWDGSGNTKSIKANEGVHVAIGALIRNDAQGQVETQISLGFKFKTLNFSNAKVSYRAYPLEVLEVFTLNNFRLGGGLTYHLNPKISGSGVFSDLDLPIKNTLGLIAQAEYRLTPQVSAGLRYTAISYSAKSGGGSISGNGVGFIMTAAF